MEWIWPLVTETQSQPDGSGSPLSDTKSKRFCLCELSKQARWAHAGTPRKTRKQNFEQQRDPIEIRYHRERLRNRSSRKDLHCWRTAVWSKEIKISNGSRTEGNQDVSNAHALCVQAKADKMNRKRLTATRSSKPELWRSYLQLGEK